MKWYMSWVNARPKGVLLDSRSFNMRQEGLKEHIDMLKRFRQMYFPHHEFSDVLVARGITIQIPKISEAIGQQSAVFLLPKSKGPKALYVAAGPSINWQQFDLKGWSMIFITIQMDNE
eukprot:5004312-Karenia_brevis.AAC.1